MDGDQEPHYPPEWEGADVEDTEAQEKRVFALVSGLFSHEEEPPMSPVNMDERLRQLCLALTCTV